MMNYCQTLSEFAHSTLQSQFCSETDRNRLQLEHVLYFLRPHLPHEYFQGCSHCCCDSLHNRDCLACLYGRGRPKRGGKWQFLWSYIASLDFKCAIVLDSIMSIFQLVKKQTMENTWMVFRVPSLRLIPLRWAPWELWYWHPVLLLEVPSIR